MGFEFEELQSVSLRELFVKKMEEMILSGKMPIGSKIPTERELADKMKVSRAVVNGGLSDMEAKGFLYVIPRKGTYVANYKYKGKMDVLKSIMEYNGNELDFDMLMSFIQIRRDIEGSAIYLAAQNRSDKDLEVLEDLILDNEKLHSIEEFMENSFKFYHAICISSGNMIYPLLYYSFKPVIIAHMRTYYFIVGEDGINEWNTNMKKLYQYIKEGNGKKAKESDLESIDRVEKIFKSKKY